MRRSVSCQYPSMVCAPAPSARPHNRTRATALIGRLLCPVYTFRRRLCPRVLERRPVEESVEHVVGALVVARAHARVRARHDGELLVGIGHLDEEVDHVLYGGDAVPLATHDERRHLELL